MIDSVSVILPHHDRPDFVREALLSIVNQSVKPTEILLVDDCSSPEIRQKLQELSSLATILTTPRNLGAAAARNFGAQAAKGEWLAFLDDDDCWMPDKQERQIRYLEAHPQLKALGGGALMVTPEGRQEYWGGRQTRRLTLAGALCDTASMPQALMIRRDLFLELGGFDPAAVPLEDREFGVRLIASGHQMHFLAEPLFVYRRGGREQLSLQLSTAFKANIRIIDRHDGLARKEFGPFGSIRLKARCYRQRGRNMGRLRGRLLWALGRAMEAVFGRLRGDFGE